MEAIILGNPYDVIQGGVTPIEIPAYEADEALIKLSDGYNPYIVSSDLSDSYWYRYTNGLLRPLASSDKVIIGGTSLYGTETLRVVGGINISGLQIGSTTYVSAILDEDDMSSDSNTAVPTQQSVKAYVDLQIGGYLQSGDNISELVNDEGYISSESDPIFVASVASSITSTDYSHWTSAYNWGNHASAGYLTSESDPIFVASVASGITNTNITNWNTAYTNNHVHTNKTLLDSLISSGFGNQFLANDGTYHSISNTVAGSNTYIQFNDGGIFGGDSNLIFDKLTGTLQAYTINITNELQFNGSNTYITNTSGDLVFYDNNYGTPITLSTLASAATNPWTIGSGYITYGTGSDMVGINITPSLAELEVFGHIIANNFDSNYIRYFNTNLLIGEDAGAWDSSGSRKFHVADNGTYSLIEGDFAGNYIKVLDLYTTGKHYFEDANESIFSDMGVLYVQDTTSELTTPIALYHFIDGTYNALKSEFTAYNTVRAISASNVSTWNSKESGLGNPSVDGYVLSSTAAGVRSWIAPSGGGITPTDNVLKWDGSPNYYYRFYSSKTEAGGTSSDGKFYLGTSDPDSTLRGNYDGYLYATKLYSDTYETINTNSLSTWTGSSNITTLGTITTGIWHGTTIDDSYITSASTWNAKQAAYTNLTAFGSLANSTGYLYNNGSGILSYATPTVTLTDDILDFSTNKYTPYATQQSFLSFDTSTTSPSLTTRLNLNGILYSTGLNITSSTNRPLTVFAYSDSYSSLISGTHKAISITRAVSAQTGTISQSLISIDNLSSGTANTTGTLIAITDNPTSSGTTDYKLLNATIGSTERISFYPRVADGVSATAYLLDTHNSLSTGGAKIVSVKNQGVEKNYLDKDGAVWYAAATPNTVDGLLWNDSTQKCFKVYENGVNQYDTKVLFTQTSTQTISNTTTETTLFGSGIGTLTLPANFLVVGKAIKVFLTGYMSGVSGDTATIKVILGGTTLVTSTATMPATFTNAYFDASFEFTCRTTGSSGTIFGQGRTMITAGVGLTTSYTRALTMTSTVTINTTTSNAINTTYTWGTASTSNNINVTNASIIIES